MSFSYLGEIRLFAGDYVPQGWSSCDGTTLSIQDNSELFEAVGKAYGGDGFTTFALPNLSGSAPIHIGTGFSLGATGSAPLDLGSAPVNLIYMMNTGGMYEQPPYVGEVCTFAFGTIPRGWYECNGQLLQIESNTALYSLLGTRFGGDGDTTFGLPDLRGSATQGTAAAQAASSIGYLVLNYCIAAEGSFPPKP